MKPVVLVEHVHDCPLHGKGTVTTGSTIARLNGRQIARVGDSVSCGAVIVSGSLIHKIEGSAVARQGDSTSHGGTLIEGDAIWRLE